MAAESRQQEGSGAGAGVPRRQQAQPGRFSQGSHGASSGAGWAGGGRGGGGAVGRAGPGALAAGCRAPPYQRHVGRPSAGSLPWRAAAPPSAGQDRGGPGVGRSRTCSRRRKPGRDQVAIPVRQRQHRAGNPGAGGRGSWVTVAIPAGPRGHSRREAGVAGRAPPGTATGAESAATAAAGAGARSLLPLPAAGGIHHRRFRRRLGDVPSSGRGGPSHQEGADRGGIGAALVGDHVGEVLVRGAGQSTQIAQGSL